MYLTAHPGEYDAKNVTGVRNQELRDQRRELKDELDNTRDRVRELEDMVYHGERRTIKRYVDENPGATYDEIIQHLIETVPSRVTTHLGDLEGDELRNEDDGYYPANGDRS